MLVVDQISLEIRQGAGDIERLLGVTAWQDQPLNLLLENVLVAEIAAVADSTGKDDGFLGQIRAATGEMMDVTAYLSQTFIIIELEAASTDIVPASRVTNRLATKIE